VTTVADGGVLVPGRPRSWFYRRRFVRACVELLTDENRWRELASRGRARALREYAPARIAAKLIDAAHRASVSRQVRQ